MTSPFLAHVASLDLSTAVNRLAALLLLAALAWAGVVAAMASWAPTARWARVITPRALRLALFTAVSSTLAISPARAGDLDGLPLPTRGATTQPTGSVVARAACPSD